MAKRKTPGLNTQSTADIAFLLLCYFLMTSTMDQQNGLQRRLPPMPDKDQKVDDQKVNRRNIIIVKINSADRLFAGNEMLDISQLKDKIKEFLTNPADDPNLPEKEMKDKESNKPKKKKIKSDNIMDYIVKGDKAYIVKILHILIDGLTAPIDIARPIRFLCDKQVFRDKEEFRLPYKAFIKEFPMLEKYISDTAYNRLISPNNKPYKNSIKYQNLKNFFILG